MKERPEDKEYRRFLYGMTGAVAIAATTMWWLTRTTPWLAYTIIAVLVTVAIWIKRL